MAKGGRRPGAGRPKGSINKRSMAARAAVQKTGMLPHEALLAIAQGSAKKVLGHDVTDAERIECFKAAAPYFAPRLAAMMMKVTDKTNPWEEIFDLIGKRPREVLPQSAQAKLYLIANGTAARASPAKPVRSGPASR